MTQENFHRQDPVLLNRTQIMNLLWGIELVLMGIFVLWMVFFYKKGLWELISPGLLEPTNWLLGVGIGVGLLVFSGVLFWLSKDYRDVVLEIRTLLIQPIGYKDILVMALLSGAIEELFFRGFLQTEAGIVIASIIFGLVHSGLSWKYLTYTLWAVAAGFLLGYAYHFSGALILPIIAHTVNNLLAGCLLKRYFS